MTQEIIDKAIKLQKDINRYKTIIRYAATNELKFHGTIGESNVSDDEEFAKIIHDYCKNKQRELIEKFNSL